MIPCAEDHTRLSMILYFIGKEHTNMKKLIYLLGPGRIIIGLSQETSTINSSKISRLY